MAMNESQSEPSMEEILASIRRIIAEDDAPPAVSDEVLDLQEPVEAPAPRPAPAQSPAPSMSASLGHDDLVFEDALDADTDDYVAPAAFAPREAPPALQAAWAAEPAPTTNREEALLSEAVASATAAALTRLAGSMRVADYPNQTIEGLVRELLKPMLKEWLDTNLRGIVEAKVESALERVARLAR
jgi:cell pole-organizing protein PopZ